MCPSIGFWSLALSVIREWDFARRRQPETVAKADDPKSIPESDQVPSSRATSPSKTKTSDEAETKTKMSLFKENTPFIDSKQSQGAMDFDMSAFF